MTSPLYAHVHKMRGQLITDLHNAIDESLHSAMVTADKAGNPHEPELVYEIMRHAVPEFNKTLKAALAPLKLRAAVRGFFCHQKPMVTWTGIQSSEPPSKKKKRRSVEIGDLLIIVHCHIHGKKWRNALLLQAKKETIPSSLTPDAQFYLYDMWPDFWYKNKPLNKTVTSLKPRRVKLNSHSGAQYLCVASWPWPGLFYPISQIGVIETQSMVVSGSKRLIPTTMPLAESIYELMVGGTGRWFRSKSYLPDSASDWSQVVWDLIDSLRNAQTTLKIAANNSGARASHLCFLSGELTGRSVGFNLDSDFVLAFGEIPPVEPRERAIETMQQDDAIPTIEIHVQSNDVD